MERDVATVAQTLRGTQCLRGAVALHPTCASCRIRSYAATWYRAHLYDMRPKDHAKHQHYVPRVLLRGFTSGRSEQVYVFDKSDSRVFRTSIRNVAGQRGFYDVDTPLGKASLEATLSRLESNVAPLLDRIRSERAIAWLSLEQRAHLALFAMVQNQRTANFRAVLAQMSSELAEQFRGMGLDPSKIQGFKELKREDLKRFTVQSVMDAHQFVPYLMTKAWILLGAAPNRTFYIADNPIAMQNQKDFGFYGNIGLAVPGIEIYLPISSELTLGWLSESFAEECSDGLDDTDRLREAMPSKLEEIDSIAANLRLFQASLTSGTLQPRTDENVTNLNALQVRYAERYVYSREDDFDLARQVLADDPGLRIGPRGKVG
jgi:hypothetical protein